VPPPQGSLDEAIATLRDVCEMAAPAEQRVQSLSKLADLERRLKPKREAVWPLTRLLAVERQLGRPAILPPPMVSASVGPAGSEADADADVPAIGSHRASGADGELRPPSARSRSGSSVGAADAAYDPDDASVASDGERRPSVRRAACEHGENDRSAPSREASRRSMSARARSRPSSARDSARDRSAGDVRSGAQRNSDTVGGGEAAGGGESAGNGEAAQSGDGSGVQCPSTAAQEVASELLELYISEGMLTEFYDLLFSSASPASELAQRRITRVVTNIQAGFRRRRGAASRLAAGERGRKQRIVSRVLLTRSRAASRMQAYARPWLTRRRLAREAEKRRLDGAAGVLQARVRRKAEGRKPQWPWKLAIMAARAQKRKVSLLPGPGGRRGSSRHSPTDRRAGGSPERHRPSLSPALSAGPGLTVLRKLSVVASVSRSPSLAPSHAGPNVEGGGDEEEDDEKRERKKSRAWDPRGGARDDDADERDRRKSRAMSRLTLEPPREAA
jgi:hypothetical protein